MRTAHPEDWDQLAAGLRSWPFLVYILHNVEASLLMASRDIMDLYASLVPDDGLRHRVMGVIASEYDLAREAVGALLGAPAEIRRPRLMKAIQLRERALTRIHQEQVHLLKSWRAEGGDETLSRLLVTVNAISMGQKMTG